MILLLSACDFPCDFVIFVCDFVMISREVYEKTSAKKSVNCPSHFAFSNKSHATGYHIEGNFLELSLNDGLCTLFAKVLCHRVYS